MSVSKEQLEKIASLAYLDIPAKQEDKITKEFNAIIDFVSQLQSIPTEDVPPLFQPLDNVQPLRKDIITESEQVAALKKIAPSFEDDLYLVPSVLDGGDAE